MGTLWALKKALLFIIITCSSLLGEV